MAKKKLQDIRVDFIEAIGRTENLRILRSICDDIYKRKATFNISISEIENMFNEGYNKIKELLGDEVEYFTPMILMDAWTPMVYFKALSDGFSKISDRDNKKLAQNRRKVEFESKLYKAKEKGKLDKADDFEKIIGCIKKPQEYFDKYTKILIELKESLEEGKIDDFSYKEYEKRFKKYIKEAKNALNILSLFDEDKELKGILSFDKKNVLNTFKSKKSIALFIGMEEAVRYYFSYPFFDRNKDAGLTYNKYLVSYDGDSKIDFEHVLVLYEYLKQIEYENLNEIEAVLIYTALEHIALYVLPNAMKSFEIYIKSSITDFTTDKLPCYIHNYSTAYLLPSGYKGYVFEPSNLNQQSFISAIDRSKLDVEMMVGRYKEAQEYMRNRENGILFEFLPKDLENKLLPNMVTADFPIQYMNGVYSKSLLDEMIERRDIFGGESSEAMTTMYMRVVKPYNLEVLGSYIRTFCNKLSLLKDKEMIYIYYVSPQRIGIAVRDDVDENMLSEVFEERFLKTLKEVKAPTLNEFLTGVYL